jgi:hypothetical protein
LRKRPIVRNIPKLQSHPLNLRHGQWPFERAALKFWRVAKWNGGALDSFAVAFDEFGVSEGKGPFDIGTYFSSTNLPRVQQDFSGADEVIAFSEAIENG